MPAEALARRMAESASQRRLLEGLAEAFGLDAHARAHRGLRQQPHLGGTNAVGGMIVAGPDGFMKNAYRKFTIRRRAPTKRRRRNAGDDYAMMREVLTRRFARALKEDPDRERGAWPDLVLIDGGKGQLNAAQAVLADLGIDDVAAASASPRGPTAMPGASASSCPDGRVLAPSPNATRCSISCSGCATRRTASPSAAIAQAVEGDRRIAARRDPWHRRPAQEGAAAPFRLGPRGRARRP